MLAEFFLGRFLLSHDHSALLQLALHPVHFMLMSLQTTHPIVQR